MTIKTPPKNYKIGNHTITVLTDIGGRSEQQDRPLLTSVNRHITAENLTDIYAKTHTALDPEITEKGGACAVIAIVQPAGTPENPDIEITHANLGDCRASLIIIKPSENKDETGTLHCIALTQDDNPNKPHEKARLEELGVYHKFEDGYLNGLAISAVFGDTASHRDADLRRTPITGTTLLSDPKFNIQEGDIVFLAVETDGSHMGHTESKRSAELKKQLNIATRLSNIMDSPPSLQTQLASAFTMAVNSQMEQHRENALIYLSALIRNKTQKVNDALESFKQSVESDKFTPLKQQTQKTLEEALEKEISRIEKIENDLKEGEYLPEDDLGLIFAYYSLYIKDHTDNISFILARIDPSNNTPYAMGEIDGHGKNGTATAESVQQSLNSQLRVEMA